jgi:integrase
MSSLVITTRRTASGPRYVVRYRLGGRAYPVIHAGSFKTLREAKVRRGLVAGELAAGRNPAALLAALLEPPKTQLFADLFDAFVASRVDVTEATLSNYRSHRGRLVAALGARNPNAIGWQTVQELVRTLSLDLAPLSIRRYLGTLAQVLDYAELDPNPARDRRIRLPRSEQEPVDPPTSEQVTAIVANAPKRWRLALRVLEQTGMRVGELVALEWGDIDRVNLQIRVKRGKTRAARRWVKVPEWLLEEIEATCPPDDRVAERRVFLGASRQTVGNAMRNGCTNAGIANYALHSLRHRYISVKLREGVPVTEVCAQVGHSRKSITLDTYAHVIAD